MKKILILLLLTIGQIYGLIRMDYVNTLKITKNLWQKIVCFFYSLRDTQFTSWNRLKINHYEMFVEVAKKIEKLGL